jgi:hypothetical protein
VPPSVAAATYVEPRSIHFWPSPITSENFARRGKKSLAAAIFFTRLRQGFGVACHRSASAQRSGETGGAAITDMGSGRSRATDFGRNIEYPEDLTELTKRTEARDIPACRPTMSRQFFGKFSRRRFKLRGVDFS